MEWGGAPPLPYQGKPCKMEIGNAWKVITENCSSYRISASDLLAEQSPLDKALKEIVEKFDKAEKTCGKTNDILIENSKILEEQL